MTEFEKLDKDKNGQIDKSEFQALELEDRRLKYKTLTKRETRKEWLVKACCAGMLLYPFIMVLASVLGFETAESSSPILQVYTCWRRQALSLVTSGLTVLERKKS